jgi:hypothetical protein
MGKKNRVRGTVGVCTYCGKTAPLTPDHVPPKNLFLSPRPSNLITVPSCEICNGGASKDDEYFKTMIVLRQDVANNSQASRILGGVMSSLGKPERKGFTQSILNSMTRVPVFTESGLYMQQLGAMNVSLSRVRRVLNRTVRGLFFEERKERLPTDCLVESYPDARLPDPRVMSLLMSQPPKTIGDSVFSYRVLFAEDERYGSAWLLTFYGVVRIVSLTLPRTRTSETPASSG